jgi:hypothetical protein
MEFWKAEGCCDLEDGVNLLFFFVFEMKEIVGVSRIWRVPWRIF